MTVWLTAAQRGRALCVLLSDHTTRCHGLIRKDSAIEECLTECLLPGWKFSFVYPLAETLAWAVPESQQSLCLVHIFDCRLLLDVSALTCDLEDNRNMPKRNHQTTISLYRLSHIPKACVTSTKISPKTLSQPYFLSLSAFHLSFLPSFLNSPPGMESRCGTGRRRDCLLGYKERGGLRGA